MIRIFFLENENPYRNSSGGIMSYLMNLSSFLKTQNITTILCGVGQSQNSPDQVFTDFYQIVPDNNPTNYKYIFSLFYKLRTIQLTGKTIIHAQRPDMLIPAIFLKRKAKLVCSLHGAHDLAVYAKKGFIQGKIYQFLQSIAFKFTDLLIAVDQKTKEYYLYRYPSIKNKIKLVPIGIDTLKFLPMDRIATRKKHNFSANDIIIIFVGRIEKEKNIQFIIDSFVEVKHKIKNAKLLFVGSGRQEHELKNYVTQNKIKDVIFKGEVANEIIPELLNCSDVFAFASLYEGSPTVIKEALACNIPVVSVDVGDVKSVIKNLDGCFISKREIVDFSTKLIAALTNIYTFSSRDRVLGFDNKKVSQQTLILYKNLIGINS